MGRQSTEAIVTQLAEEIMADYPELELVDVNYAKEGATWVLRVFIDKEAGVDLEDCEKVSRRLSASLDEVDPIPGSYSLEVSSPGLERPLTKDAHFQRFAGKLVSVRTYAPFQGSKQWKGRLMGLVDGAITVEVDGEVIKIPRDQVAKANLAIEF
ncbi:MAG: ribosome maturation factor RimP [Firmicutes bacterium]|nr:ribosome maturation factor RimP [Bacillota bacterium]